MPENVDWTELRTTKYKVFWFLTQIVIQKCLNEKKTIKEIFPDLDKKNIKIKMTINNIEVPVLEVMEQYIEKIEKIQRKNK